MFFYMIFINKNPLNFCSESSEDLPWLKKYINVLCCSMPVLRKKKKLRVVFILFPSSIKYSVTYGSCSSRILSLSSNCSFTAVFEDYHHRGRMQGVCHVHVHWMIRV